MARSQFDLKKVDVIDFLEALEVENLSQPVEDQAQFSCPFSGHSHGDKSPSAYMNLETTQFFCHGCHRKGNAISFLAELENISNQESIYFIRERYGGGRDPDQYSAREEVERMIKDRKARDADEGPVPMPILDDDVIDEFYVNWFEAESMCKSKKARDKLAFPPWAEYMLVIRGFSPGTLSAWEIGYDPISDRIMIPVRDADGHLVGFKGRAWESDRKPKYLVVGDPPEGGRYGFPRYEKSRVVYGMDSANRGDMIICEGELNVLALYQADMDNAVAVNGSHLSDAQVRILLRYADSATLFFDSDSAGLDATHQAYERLYRHISLWVVPDHEGDAADMVRDGEMDRLRELLDSAESMTKLLLAGDRDRQ